jgi:hypothetical protein
VGGNRFAESVKRTILSLLAIAELMQISTYNQSTHQIFVTSASALKESSPAAGFGNIAPPASNFSVSDGDTSTMPIERIGNQVMFAANTDAINNHIKTLRAVSRLFLDLLLDRG